MSLRRLALAVAVLLSGLLPAAVASRGGNGGVGIAIRHVAYDAAAGTVEVQLRWNRQELRRDGDDAGHVLLWAGIDGDAPILLRDEQVALGRDHRTRLLFRLAPEERALLEGGEAKVTATHKHDDDGGLYDRAHVDALAGWMPTPSGNSPRSFAAADSPDCGTIAPGADLEGCDFSLMNLSDVDASDANLSYATLDSTILLMANLSGADLSDATMEDAYLADANLADANLAFAALYDADLYDANLTGADLTGAFLGDANLTGANLTEAALDDAIFCQTTMPDGSVNDADCQ